MTRPPDDHEPGRRPPRLRHRRRRQRLDHRPLPGRRSLPDPRPAAQRRPSARHRTRPGSRTVTLTISDTTMTSDQSPHTARHAPSRNGWEVSWLPGRTLDRNTAITAMVLADTSADERVREGHRLWPHIQGWAAELGLSRTVRSNPARRLLRPLQPPSHYHPRNPDYRPPARRRARLPDGDRARCPAQAARIHNSKSCFRVCSRQRN